MIEARGTIWHRARAVASVLVVLVGFVTVAGIVAQSLDPEAYFYYATQDRSEWSWPVKGVVLISIMTVLETLAGYAVLRRSGRWRVWRRALLALSALIPLGVLLLAMVIHMPGYYLLHLTWLWMLIAVLFVSGVGSAAVELWGIVRRPAEDGRYR